MASHNLKASHTCRLAACNQCFLQVLVQAKHHTAKAAGCPCRPHTDTFLVVQESHVHPGIADDGVEQALLLLLLLIYKYCDTLIITTMSASLTL